MTRTPAPIVLILAAATLFLPLSTFAYRGDDPGISSMSLDNQNNNNNHLPACTSKSSQQRGAVPSFCNGNLVVIKHIINDDGGTSSARDFTISIARSVPGEESPGTGLTLSPGSFSVSEEGPAGYTQSLSGDCTGTINAGDNKVCTVTNNDNPQTGGASITIRSVRCISDPNNGPTVAVEMTVSGQSHDSHAITVQVQTFAPSGYLVSLSQYTVPANAPDPATTSTGTAFVSSPNAPAGTYKIVAVTSDGQAISTTFQAPDCSIS